MCEFFEKRGYPASVVQGHHPAQQIDRQSALQTSQKENNNRIPFTLTFHPHNHAVKSIILKNYKLLQNDLDTGRIFSQPPLASFKRDKNLGNFLVRSAFQTSAPESLYGGQFTLSTQLIKRNYLTILLPTQHQSFFKNLPPNSFNSYLMVIL